MSIILALSGKKSFLSFSLNAKSFIKTSSGEKTKESLTIG